MNWNLNDEVVINLDPHRSWGASRPQYGKVVKVARVYFTVETVTDRYVERREFRIENGWEKGDYSYGRCYPKAVWEEREKREDVLRALRLKGVSLQWQAADLLTGISTSTLLKIAELVCG